MPIVRILRSFGPGWRFLALLVSIVPRSSFADPLYRWIARQIAIACSGGAPRVRRAHGGRRRPLPALSLICEARSFSAATEISADASSQNWLRDRDHRVDRRRPRRAARRGPLRTKLEYPRSRRCSMLAQRSLAAELRSTRCNCRRSHGGAVSGAGLCRCAGMYRRTCALCRPFGCARLRVRHWCARRGGAAQRRAGRQRRKLGARHCHRPSSTCLRSQFSTDRKHRARNHVGGEAAGTRRDGRRARLRRQAYRAVAQRRVANDLWMAGSHAPLVSVGQSAHAGSATAMCRIWSCFLSAMHPCERSCFAPASR